LAESQNLSIGFVPQRAPNAGDELCFELLDHQGIEYEIIEPASHDSQRRYHVVLISRTSTDLIHIARERSFSDNHIISVDKVVRLDRVLGFLSGKEDQKPRDRLDLVVNDEERKLRSVIRQEFEKQGLPFVFKWFWPNFRRACCILTHDIDWLTYSPLHRAVFRGPLKPKKSLSLIKSGLLKKRDYGWNIPKTLELEKKYGLRSTFFFLTKYEANLMPIFKRSLELLKEQNSEIALHGYHASHKNREALSSELKTFSKNTGEKPAGLRYHILKFRVPDSWVLESEAGLKYDATFSYNEYYGFRSEICFPFHPFNGARLRIIEIPTGFMDWTALYRNTRGAKLTSKIKQIMGLVEGFNGAFVVNFHNTYLNPDTFGDIYSAYEDVLKSTTSRDYWICTARECAEWWEYRSKMRLSPRLDRAGNVIVASESRITLALERSDSTVEQVKTTLNRY